MIRISGGDFLFKVEGIEIEGSDDIGVDVQYPWEDSRPPLPRHRMQIKPFYIDKYPVTNAQFKKFLDASHYHPKDDLNFLKDWKGEHIQRAGQTNQSPGSRLRMPVPMPNGLASDFLMSGSGNMRHKAPMAEHFPGATVSSRRRNPAVYHNRARYAAMGTTHQHHS